jgi:hypothetical protein
MRVSLGGSDLFDVCGFALQKFARPSGRLRASGFVVPGQSGFQTQIPTPLEHDAYELGLEGFVRGSIAELRSLVLATAAWRALVFEDLDPLAYQVQGLYVDQDTPMKDIASVSIGFAVSPPCLLGADVTDTTSPVVNPGDYPCPGVWTVEASGAFTLTCNGIVGAWTGGVGTVVIDAETYRVTLEGTESPRYWMGGYPWLAVGPNVVTCTPGFSVVFNPRYA